MSGYSPPSRPTWLVCLWAATALFFALCVLVAVTGIREDHARLEKRVEVAERALGLR